jgi:hypothetical protein
MVAVPTPTRPTSPPDVIVATFDASLVYVNAPVLLDEGALTLNELSFIFFCGIVNVPIVGAIGETTNTEVTLPLL